MTPNNSHEAQVMRFFEQCEQTMPEAYQEVVERTPTLSSRQMARREATEIAISQLASLGLRTWLHGVLYSDSGTSEFDGLEEG